MAEPSTMLAVDLGGTQMRAAIVNTDGALLLHRSEPTPGDATCPDALMDLVGDVLAEHAADHAVIGVPGRVDHRRGRLHHAPNLPPHWPDALVEDSLTEHLGLPVALANDADVAAVGEAYFGSGQHHVDLVYLTVSTGIGAGVLLDRRLVTGSRSLAEVGHTVLDLAAGRRGEPASFENLASGTALGRRAELAGLPADGARVVELVHEGEPDAKRVWNELVEVLSVGITNLAFLFAPSAIVLGGGVGRNDDLLLAPVREALDRHGPRDLAEPIEVLVAGLGDDAGLVGAAAWHRARTGPCRG